MSKSAQYLILDAYPDPKNEDLQQFLGATIGCWIRMDLCGLDDAGLAIAKERLQGFWIVAGEVDQHIVSEKSYGTDENGGRELFRQSLNDGFVANIHRYPRETISLDDDNSGSSIEKLLNISRLAARLNGQGCVSLYSPLDEQWANGVTPEGADFIPLWAGSEPPLRWLDFWPNYEPYPVKADELVTLLPSFQSVNSWVGVETSHSSLVTVHPLALRDAIVASIEGL